jgi:Ring finger domain
MPPSEENGITTSSMNSNKRNESVEQYLLAASKDRRDVQQCSDLLRQILRPAASARTSRILAEYISWILYILLTTKTTTLRKEGGTVQRATTTPGMEVCQVRYCRESGALEKTTLWSRLSSTLLRNSSMTIVALFSVTFLYGIRWQSERIMQSEVAGASVNHNQFQGQARRNVFLLQRQEMIRRSRDVVRGAAAMASSTATDGTNVKPPDQSRIGDRMLPRLGAILRAIVVALDKALSSKVTNGPHDRQVATTNIPEATSTVSSTTLEDRLYQVFLWIFQFHVACYCISGNHPTIFHRFVKDRVVTNEAVGRGSEPVQESSSIVPLVGALLLCRLSYQLLFHAISQPLIRYCATLRYSSLLRWRKTINSVETTRRTPVPAQHTVSLVGRSPQTERASHMACYICQQPPLYPSCLIPCGHVFCWYCIQQWITDHDTSCPICRVPSSSKDVMHLYNV